MCRTRGRMRPVVNFLYLNGGRVFFRFVFERGQMSIVTQCSPSRRQLLEWRRAVSIGHSVYFTDDTN